MTISAVVPVITFVGSSGAGTLGPFSLVKSGTPITFKTNSHIKVRRYSSISDTSPTLLVEDTDYTLTGGPSAGVVTLTSPQTGLLDTEYLRVSREEPKTQDTAFGTGANFSSDAIEGIADGHTRQIQEVDRSAGQALRYDFLTGDAIPTLGPFEAAIGKIAYFSGTAASPTVSYVTGANIDAVGPIASDIAALSLITADIEDVADINAEIIAVSQIKSDVSTVSGINGDVTTIAANLSTYQTANTNFSVLNTVNTNTAAILTAATTATTGATTATTKAGEASTSATGAAASAGTATAQAVISVNAKNLAEQWASEDEDTEVTTGKFSAFHYALKTEAFKDLAEAAAVSTAADRVATAADALKYPSLDTRTNGLDFGIRTGELFPLAEDPLDTTTYPLAEDAFSGFSGFGLMGASETEILNTDGGVLFARWSDGSSSEIGNLSYPTAGVTLFEGFLQTEIVCPWVDVATQYAARWQLTWDEFSSRTSNAITRVGKDLYAWQGNGQPVLLRLEDGAARSTDNGSWADFTLIDGQSLATNRTGPSRNSSTETWGQVLRFDAGVTPKHKMLGGTIQGGGNSTEGTDTTLENISTATLSNAVSTPVGASVDINDGNPLQAESAFITNVTVQTETEAGTRDGRQHVIGALAMGGQEITHFLKTSSGGQDAYWTGAWSPWVVRLGEVNTKTAKNFTNIFINGTKDHEDGMTKATYAGHQFDLATDRKVVVDANLSGATYRFIQPQTHKLYDPSKPKPTGYLDYETSAIADAVFENGINTGAGYGFIYCAGAMYWLTFSGISHPDDMGYHAMHSWLGFVAADIKRWEDAGGGKWMPPHATAIDLASDNLSALVTYNRTPYSGPLTVHVPNNPSPATGLPKKDGWGFKPFGGTAPTVTAVEVVNEDQLRLTFSAAWTGTGREMRIAAEANTAGRTFLSDYPGWQSSDGDPLGTGDTWEHYGAGANFYRPMPWRHLITGNPIHAYPVSQRFSIAD